MYSNYSIIDISRLKRISLPTLYRWEVEYTKYDEAHKLIFTDNPILV